MWPLLAGKIVAVTAAAAGGLFLYQQYKQQQERQQVFWEPFAASQLASSNDDRSIPDVRLIQHLACGQCYLCECCVCKCRVKEDVLKLVQARLLEITQMAPGNKRRCHKLLRAQHAHLDLQLHQVSNLCSVL